VWTVLIGEEFDPELVALAEAVQDEIALMIRLLGQFGPLLGRPKVDTLKNSKHANMKEFRFEAADGVWRVASGFRLRHRAKRHSADRWG
jgi:hypothetical protein